MLAFVLKFFEVFLKRLYLQKNLQKSELDNRGNQNLIVSLFSNREMMFSVGCEKFLSGCRELNSGYTHPMRAYYRYTTPR